MAGFENQGGLGGLGGFFQRPVVQDTLNAVFDSMISSPSNNMMQGFGQSYDRSIQRREDAQQRAAFEQALIAAGMDPAQARTMAANPQAAKFALDQQQSTQTKNTTRDWLLGQGFSETDADAAVANPAILSQIMKRAQGGSDAQYGLNPIWGTDENGNPALGVLGNDGTFKKIDTGGFALSTGTEQIDLGDRFAIKDKRSGEVIGYIPKNLRAAERNKAIGGQEGKSLGEDIAIYQSMASKLPGLEAVVERLGDLADKATYTWAGQGVDAVRRQFGMSASDGAKARAEYTAVVDNQVLPLLRDTFGAQFTVEEGIRLRATLGDENKSPEEKKATLKAFIEQKRRDIEEKALRASIAGEQIGDPAAMPSSPSGSSLKDKYGLD